MKSKKKKDDMNRDQHDTFDRNEFSKLLSVCHNIIRNNDKLSPEAAFDEISKILFVKIRYERKHKGEELFTRNVLFLLKNSYLATASNDSLPFYRHLFEETKKDFAKDDLFEQNDTFQIREASFEAIIEKLESYNLSKTSDDVKGIAFESFLGRTFRGELGQFFTPRKIVDFMVEAMDPQEGELICDPCCGSGGFLIRAFEYVKAKIECDSKGVNGRSLGARIHELSHNCIFGVDANPRMARTAKMNMIMHGDGHGGVHHHDGLLNVNGIFENHFDVILTNPPFGSRVDRSQTISEADKFFDKKKIAFYIKRYGRAYSNSLKQVNDHIGTSLLDLYEVGKYSGLTEVLFVERCLKLLKPGGRMGIVLPEGVLNNANLDAVREIFEGMARIILIVSLPQDVFAASGATVKPSLVFFRRFTEDEICRYNAAKIQAKGIAEDKYAEALRDAEKEYATAISGDQKRLIRNRIKSINTGILTEVRKLVKSMFDYPIPFAEIEKAGMTATGAECENELPALLAEFIEYRKKNHLWSRK